MGRGRSEGQWWFNTNRTMLVEQMTQNIKSHQDDIEKLLAHLVDFGTGAFQHASVSKDALKNPTLGNCEEWVNGYCAEPQKTLEGQREGHSLQIKRVEDHTKSLVTSLCIAVVSKSPLISFVQAD